MTRAAASSTVLVAMLLTACGAEPASITIEGETATLAATDPTLFDALKSLTFLFYDDGAGDNACGELVDLDVAQLNDRDPKSHQGINTDDRTEHAFGAIQGAGERAFVVLGSVRALSAAEQADPLPILGGTVTAIGCRQVVIEEGTRFSVPIVLFPAGLR